MKEECVTIADFTPNHRPGALEPSVEELEEILSSKGIECGLDESRSYRVIVPSARAEEARELLKGARFKRGGVLKML